MDIRKITDELSVAPQIGASDIAAIVAAGFRSVICNRPDGEFDRSALLRRHRSGGEGPRTGVALPAGALWRGHHRRRPGVRRPARRVAEAGARLLPIRNALRHPVVALGSRQAAARRDRQPCQCRGLRRRLGDGTHPQSGGVTRPRSVARMSDVRDRAPAVIRPVCDACELSSRISLRSCGLRGAHCCAAASLTARSRSAASIIIPRERRACP